VSISTVEKPDCQRREIAVGVVKFLGHNVGVAFSPGAHCLLACEPFTLGNEFEQEIGFALFIGQARKNLRMLARGLQTSDWLVSFMRAANQIFFDSKFFGASRAAPRLPRAD